MDNLELLSNVSYLSLVIPFVVGAIRWRHLNVIQRIIFAIVVLTVFNDSLTIVLNRNEQNNLWVYHFYEPLYFLLVALLYRKTVEFGSMRKAVDILTIVFLIFSVINSIFFQPLDQFNANAIRIGMIVFIVLVLVYFQSLLKAQSYTELERKPVFWMSVGLLLYNSGALTIFILGDYFLESDRELVTSFWSLNVIFNIVLIGFYSIALWVTPQE